ncbi:hypothetical protein MYCTH_2309825 [Thermothelomyces thermophilus ATCC 42464]|uniref:J domain-containing protein n=1 Tax=Thermothelomyces thermophilus (strain ATCC 42464 / BCRC 31852 / DSM 1799) TaxID=573729 RepID=G2QKR7_THET4|nr:uncharacterized protein MYCTH_2309825 [Thermothelomyces thermophilus ATCC 42464]AEO60549.1 hypothetical protein MYCTH_2309825 [Thermothelomyces thermophilus ATCC 42464]
MVKLDYNRDYYADLELPGPVDIAEVKKQFKKLALKWHPDRNPGKEEEAKEKFLVIQAAHEILTDPNTKSKFDAHRQRTPKPGASGVRGNPWQYTAQEVNQKFGVPPRRPPMPTRPPAPTAAASTKHWDWAHKAKSKTDNLRANMEAWERARPQSKPSQPSASASASSARPPKPPPREPPIPRTASQARRQEAAFGSRKSGYAPASPAGDEPPVKNRHYNSGTDAAEASKSTPASTDDDPLSSLFSETFLDNRQRTPYAANVGERTNPFEPLNINRAKSMRDGPRRFQEGAADTPPTPPPRQRSASTGSENIKRSTDEIPRPSEQSATNGFQYHSRASARYSPRGADTNSAPPTATFSGPNSSTSSVNSSTNATVNGDASDQSKQGTKFFSVPTDGKDTAAHQARFTRNSADNINTRFVAEEKESFNFQFSAGTAGSVDDSFLRAKQRARGGGHHSPLRNEFTPSAEPGSGAEKSNAEKSSGAQQAEPAKKQGDFVPEQWKEAFGPHIFVPPQPGKASTSPTRPIRPIKKPRPVRMTAGTAGMVDDEETSGEDKSKASTPASGINGSRSPNAMDIDTPPPEPAGPQAGAPRNINVEPTKPEWRPGNGATAEPKLGAGLKAPNLNPTSAGSEDAEDFVRPLFSEFRNVEPFAPPKPSGLGSFADLSSNLPFPSRPSAKIPLASHGNQQEKPTAKQLDVPSPPTAPRPPASLCIPGAKVSAPAWMNYVREFEAYMTSWSEFNRRVTDHFAARQRQNEGNGLGWLNTRGGAGVENYLRALEVDKIVRQKWMAACEAHELHFREYLGVRERVLGGS